MKKTKTTKPFQGLRASCTLRRRGRRRGQVIVLVCISLVAMMGMIGVVFAGGGIDVHGNSVMSGSGVTFYLTTGTGGYAGITLNGTSQVNFSAPTSGPLAGILFFQDRSIPSSGAASTITGNSSSSFDGALYFPTTTLTFNGNSSSNGYSIVVADKLTVSGNSSIGSNYTSLAGGSPIKGTVLAE